MKIMNHLVLLVLVIVENKQDDTHAKHIAEFAIDAIQAAAKILIDADDPSKGCK